MSTEQIKHFIVHDRHKGETKSGDFAVVNEVYCVIDDPDGGEPSGYAVYENNVLTIHLKNLKGDTGNAISGVDIVPSAEDGGQNEVTLHFSESEDVTFVVLNGTKGSTGSTGPKGEQGDSAIFDSQSETVIVTLANVTGTSTTKGMTQKAITNCISESVLDYDEEGILGLNTQYGIQEDADNGDYWRGNHFLGRLIDLQDSSGNPLYSNCTVIVKPTATGTITAKMAFVTAKGSESGDKVLYARNCSLVHVSEEVAVEIPSDAKYLYLSAQEAAGVYNAPGGVEIRRNLVDKVSEMGASINAQVTAMQQTLVENTESFERIVSQRGEDGVDIAWRIVEGIWASSNNSEWTCSVDIREHRGKRVKVTPNGELNRIAFTTTGGSSITGSTIGYAVIFSSVEGWGGIVDVGDVMTVAIPEDAIYLWMSVKRNGSADKDIKTPIIDLVETVAEKISDVSGRVSTLEESIPIHVDAANGDDANDGKSSAKAVETFSRAFELSGSEINIILHGDTTEAFTPNTPAKSVTLVGADGKKARIIKGEHITEATDEGGGIYSFVTDKVPSGAGTNYWMYHHEVPDPSTLIPISERHPAYRGKAYRCDSTRIVSVASLEDLQNSEVPAFYYDSGNTKVYTNVQPTAEHPIVLPQSGDRGINANMSNVRIANIEVMYGSIKVGGNGDTSGAGTPGGYHIELQDCAAKYAMGAGAFLWDNSKAVTLIRCEAARTTIGTDSGSGDGFNAHASHDANSDPGAIRETAMLIDCWAHDCNDDGFSDHYRSETVIIGGLYEYCGKGGITPSFGSQVEVRNAVCRRNSGAGILYTGATADNTGRTGGCVIAKNCLAENNSGSNYNVVGGTPAVDGKPARPNVMTLIGCISINAGEYGYRSSGVDNILRLVNCFDKGSASGAKNEYAIADNANLVE